MQMNIIAGERTKQYYKQLVEKATEQYELAKKARAKGFDCDSEVVCTPTMDLADRCESIVGPNGVAKRYRQIYNEMKGDRIKTIFKLFREIIEEEWTVIPDRNKRLEQAVKTALVLVTEGVVVAPLDGVPSVKISKNFDGSEYVDVYFAGPIRAAGGTAQVFPLILGDYARNLLGIDRYKPTEEEVERYVEEMQIYDEIVTRQYKLKDEEVRKIIRGCPVCINGEPTEEREVTIHKDLERIPNNRIRGGMCLVLAEGIGQKARKILSYAKMLDLDWSWLEEIIKVSKSGERSGSIEPNYTYLTRIAAGRPIFSYPSKKTGFRLRYGRCRNTGIMGKAIHPATMYILDEFIAIGTQLKVERPGKSAEIFPCDSIDGPIILLKNGEVRRVSSVEDAVELKNQIKEVLFLGDYLVSIGDFRKTAHPLMPVGYCEEWWLLELKKAIKASKKPAGINLDGILSNPRDIDCFTAVELSMQLGIPLHPNFLFYYSNITKGDLIELINAARKAEKVFDKNRIVSANFINEEKIKRILEDIGLPHKIKGNNIVVEKEFAYPFLKTVGALSSEKIPEGEDWQKILSNISGIEIRDRGGTFIGARMGRPEASRPRKMVGNPNVLFPIGLSGGNTRSINKAAASGDVNSTGIINVEIAIYKCDKCNKISPLALCPFCSGTAKKLYQCPQCGRVINENSCKSCDIETAGFSKRDIELNEFMARALDKLKIKSPDIVKGVKGLINKDKIAEPLEKGILRAYYDLHIFRDGTIRYELLNAPLTHFKPNEIGTSVKKLKKLGYSVDVEGKPLKSEEQMVELFPQDIVIHEAAGDSLVKVTKFIDDLFERFYGMKKYYSINSREELIGELVLGLAPHTSAAIVGRIIGYTKGRVNFAHPFFHLAKRRNADGDQDTVMLLMDALINFSKQYLPSTRGGRMDAPLVFTMVLNPMEIDDEAHEIETCSSYPLELYEKSMQIISPELESIPKVKDRLGKLGQYSGIGFTHDTACFDLGPKVSKYVQLGTMEEKIKSQAKLQSKIRAVEKKDALERVLVSHFLPDIIGNARAFSRQNFRCTNCNAKYRRIPLNGKCKKCGKGNLILTIAEGSVRKYLEIAKEIINSYDLSDYLKQRIILTEQEIDSIFAADKVEQKKLAEFA